MTSRRTQNPHDALVKWTFSQARHAAGELRYLLPPSLVAKMDLGSIGLCGTSLMDEQFREHQTDLLFSVKLSGQDAFVYVLFEHQSSVDPLMPFRLLEYMVKIWARWLRENRHAKRLPIIVPLVLHHSRTGWTAARTFHEVVDWDLGASPDVASLLPQFEFLLDDLNRQEDRQLREREMTAVARLVLWCLREARAPKGLADRFMPWIGLLLEAWSSHTDREAVQWIVRYIHVVAGRKAYEQLEEAMFRHLKEEEIKSFLGIPDRIEIPGLEESREEGRREERRALVTRQLTLRFGELPAAVRSRLEAADADQLGTWAERLVTAATLEEVLGD